MSAKNDRVILHCDLNNFYASVECLHNPDWRDKPVAVCGNPEARHGIVLAKNQLAKKFGVKTGEAIWEAQRKCATLVIAKAHSSDYLRFSKMAYDIYLRYTDKIESFGIDECWLDITDTAHLFGGGQKAADLIREDVRNELGCTISVGVSFNKVFAKLGSDMKKPDATTVILREDFEQKLFDLPVEELLYIGKATKAKLNKFGINTIGKLARADVEFLQSKFGKWGKYIWDFANGLDNSPVDPNGAERKLGFPWGNLQSVKSVGNSTTTVRDLCNESEVRMAVTIVAESVAERMREQNLVGNGMYFHCRDYLLNHYGKQRKVERPTNLAAEIIEYAMEIYKELQIFVPLRSVGVCVFSLSPAGTYTQTNIFVDEDKLDRLKRIECSMDTIRRRFGHNAIRRASTFVDLELKTTDPKKDNIIHPKGFFR